MSRVDFEKVYNTIGMGLAFTEGVLPGVPPWSGSKVAMLLLFSDPGALSTLLFSMACSMFVRSPGFSIANLWLI